RRQGPRGRCDDWESFSNPSIACVIARPGAVRFVTPANRLIPRLWLELVVRASLSSEQAQQGRGGGVSLGPPLAPHPATRVSVDGDPDPRPTYGSRPAETDAHSMFRIGGLT